MHLYKYGKSREGFILVYTVLITALCITAALGCFRLQCLKRTSNIKLQQDISRVDPVQRDREMLLTEMDNYICSNIDILTNDNIKNYFTINGEHKSFYDQSYIMYIKDKDRFYLCLFKNGSFSREELYNYTGTGENIFYSPLKYSWIQGRLLIE